ncbi:MAG TPA: NDP-sugar synthase [Actinomycetota bacterium]
MKAVVLVGGQGTRLRPLTATVKKELLPLVDRAILDHTLDRLVRHGVHEVVMSSPYLEELFDPFIASRHGDPSIAWVTEREALDTGGAIVNAVHRLEPDEPFFALNGDILTDLDMTAMLALHREHDAAATIALHHVDDARAFGLVELEHDGRIRAFREKPEEPIPGDVNAGTYVLDPRALARWTADRPISIEREIFPSVIDGGRAVYGFASGAYWRDLGTPENYLRAHFDLLEGKVSGVVYPAPWVAADAEVDPSARIGRRVAVGAGARVGPDAVIEDSVLHPGCSIGARSRVAGSIVGPGATVGAGASAVSSVLGEGASVPDGQAIEDARVQPFSVPET